MLNLEIGKIYLDRGGSKVKIIPPEEYESHHKLYHDRDGTSFIGVWDFCNWQNYFSNGRVYINEETPFDLVSEV